MHAATRNHIDVHRLLSQKFDSLARDMTHGASAANIIPEVIEHARLVLRHASDQAELVSLRDTALAHPIADYIYQCPLTAHAAARPRGYPGDAELIDYLYCHPARAPDISRATAAGQEILQIILDRPIAIALRSRRQTIANLIADIATQSPDARIMSVACGHARELPLIPSHLLERIAAFIAFDQDAKNLEMVSRYRTLGDTSCITPQCGTIAALLHDRELRDFDLIYSSGLYDYLSDHLCQRLTHNLFARLKPGATLLVTNVLPDTPDIGYMELFMNWSLRYRTRSQILDFAATIDAREIHNVEYIADATNNLGFLRIIKARKTYQTA